MDRREAIKTMGMAIATAALAGIKNFSMADEGVSFKRKCEFCLACVHNCPQKALTLKSQWSGAPGERNPEARYRNPNVSLNEIIKANRQ